MESLKLFMILLGCKPKGRNTEQHDIFFSIGNSLKAIVPDIIHFWPGAGTIHIDAWREVTEVDGFKINILDKENGNISRTKDQLFFLNLGGYKPGEFEEYHYKMLVVAKERSEAIKRAKETAFFKHVGFKGAESHIDDKYGIDVDDIYEIQDILPKHVKEKYALEITTANGIQKDECQLGYTILSKLTV
ncbi:MAG: DUF1543 domain-containing protein [Ferruginibacter sp.]